MRGLADANFQSIILNDTGATTNIVYENLIDDPPDFVKVIEKRKSLQQFKVRSAFGDTQICDQEVELIITFPNQAEITAVFLILPHPTERRLIFGKPALHDMKYRLDGKHEFLTVGDTEFHFTGGLNEHRKLKVNLYVADTVKDSLLNDFVQRFGRLFSDTIAKQPKHSFTYEVVLENFDYHAPRPFYSNTIQSTHVQKFVDDALADKVLVPIDDSSALVALAPVFPLVQGSKVRVVTDFRIINESLKYQSDSIPPIQLLIQNLATYSFFTTLDLKSAYYNVPLDTKGSRIGITTQFGNFEFQRLPFGLASAPAVFTRFMRHIMKELEYSQTDHTVQCYLDDIIIASKDYDAHLEVVEKVFKLLDKNDLRLTAKKVKIANDSVEFLGYLIKDGKRHVSPSKVEAIRNWKLPTTANAWYSFIGFVNFLGHFIPNVALLLQPMYKHHQFLKKKEESNIDPQLLEKNFNLLKGYLIESVGLQLFDPNEQVIVMTDASDLGVGGLLMQRWKKNPEKLVPITYFSKSFTPAQTRYSTLERELLGVLMALSHNYLLLSHDIMVYTDHQALVSISNKKSMLSHRILKFVETLSSYPITLKYLPGKKNFADFLSRFVISSQPLIDIDSLDAASTPIADLFSIGMTPFDPSLESPFSVKNTRLFQTLTDALIEELEEAFKSEEELPRKFEEVKGHFALVNEQLYFIYNERLLTIISFDECTKFMEEWHAKRHGSPLVLLDIMVEKALFHPQAKLIAISVVKNCANCDLFTSFKELPAPLQHVKTPGFGSLWHIDFVGPLQIYTGVQGLKYQYQYLFVAVEYVSGFCVAIPTVDRVHSTVWKALIHIMTYFPIPNTIVSDNASEFTSATIQKLAKSYGIKWRFSSVYYPQANSKVERVNGIIKKLLKQLQPDLSGWPVVLHQAIQTYNNTTTVFNTSPAELMFGFKSTCEWDTELVKKIITEYLDQHEFTLFEKDSMILRLEQLDVMNVNREVVKDKKHVARSQLKLLRDNSSNENTFTIGEYVFMKKLAKKSKNDPNYNGPFLIAEVTDKNAYKLKKLNGKILPNYFNVSHLRPAYQHYGSPFRSISDYTQAFGKEERELYQKTFDIEDDD